MILWEWLRFVAFYVLTTVALRLAAHWTKNTAFGPAVAAVS